MANIDIQRKKASPSPWLLVVLALALLAGAAWFFLRPAPADEPAPPAVRQEVAAPVDSLAPNSPAADARATPPPADAAAGVAQPESQAAEASATKSELLALVGTLTDLADRPDLREDVNIREQRDNLTSATARLADGDARAGLRPGLVAVATYLHTIQQHGYPALEADALALQAQAAALSGRDATAAEQQQNHDFVARATALADELSAPAR